jgi:hypothetical protein
LTPIQVDSHWFSTRSATAFMGMTEISEICHLTAGGIRITMPIPNSPRY